MSIYPGKMVLYRWRPGQVRVGILEAAAMITRLHPDGTADLTIYAAMDRDPIFQQRVPPLAADNPQNGHYWHPNEDDVRIAALEQRVADLEAILSKRAARKQSEPVA